MEVKNVTIIRLSCSTWINTPVNYQQLLWSAASLGLAFRSFLSSRETPEGWDEPSGSCCKVKEQPPAPSILGMCGGNGAQGMSTGL